MSGMRVFGFGSGMDIDQMVSDLIKAERTRRVTKLDQKKQIDIWQKELYQEINRDMASFIVDMKKDFGLLGTTSSGTLFNKSADSFTWVKSATSSEEAIATASSTAGALNGSYNVEITQLAKNVSKASTEPITTGTVGDLKAQFNMNEIFSFTLKTNVTSDDTTNFPSGEKTFTFDPNVHTIQEVVHEINTANIGVSASYDADLDRFFLNTNATGEENYFEIVSDDSGFFSPNTLSSSEAITGDPAQSLLNRFGISGDSKVTFNVDGVETELTFLETDNLGNIADTINDANIGLTASYDSDSNSFSLMNIDGGSLEIASDDNGLFTGDNHLKMDMELNTAYVSNVLKLDVSTGTRYGGKDLEFNFGDAMGLTKSSNTFSVNGINITAKAVGSTTMTVDTDVDGLYEKINTFVEKYNELIDKINGELNEKVYRDYHPLSDEEKETMTEEQIKKWENTAKSGLLKNDNILSRLVSDMRLGLYARVEGLSSSMSQLTQIGIETGEYSDKGKLIIDEAKLKKSIVNNPDGVVDLLFQEPSSEINKDDDDLTDIQKAQKYSESGLIHRMFNSMVNGMKEIIDKAGPGDDSNLLRNVKSNILVDFIVGKNLQNASISMLDEGLMILEKSITRQEDLLARIENRYYSQFSAMETALNRMNQQSSWLQSQLGQM